MSNWQKYAAIGLFSLSLGACTTVDPYTGQAQVDQARTAALLGGLALAGAAAYAYDRNRDDDDDDDYRYDRNDWYYTDSGVFYPTRGIVCRDSRRACYKNNGKLSKHWTRRIYRDQRHAYRRDKRYDD